MMISNSLYNDIDRTCISLKHGGNIDPIEVRTLLRRAQAVIEVLDSLSMYNQFIVDNKEIDGFIEHHVSIDAVLTLQQLQDLFVYFSGHWESLD